jgi:dTMP kinase
MAKKDLGLLITIEGGEGSGKSTLIKSLSEWLSSQQNKTVLKTFEPGATPLGKKIREILLRDESLGIDHKSELFLFLADRAQHVKRVIRPALERGEIVLCDRYNDSSIAYQGAARIKDSLEKIDRICQFATDNLVPDITIYLDIDPKLALMRVQGTLDRLEKESLDFHRAVRSAFLKLSDKHSERFYMIDATQDTDRVFNLAKDHLETRLKSYV